MEEWRTIEDWPKYQVSSLGRVRRGEHILALLPSSRYLVVHLSDGPRRNKVKVHRLVCRAFHGLAPIDKQDALHGPLGRLINTPENVRWGNDVDNYADRRVNGEVCSLDPHKPGELHRFAKLTRQQVDEIRSISGTQRSIAKRFGISSSHVWRIKNGIRWGEAWQ